MSNFESKFWKCAKHLEEKGTITSWEAIKKYNAIRLGSIVWDLKNKYHWNIDSELIVEADGTRYAKYTFVSKPNEE